MRSSTSIFAALISQVGCSYAQAIVNGQIFTPGIAIVNAPQPNTPLGGGKSRKPYTCTHSLTSLDTLHISLDVSANGKLQLPPYPSNLLSAIHNITIFLSSYETGRNLTVTNGTATENNSTLGDVMLQEQGSTVKHINWIWPDCLVGNGPPANKDSDRGLYNVGWFPEWFDKHADFVKISIRQNFRLNGTEQYTIFDLPIQVTNSISESANRSSCDSLSNPLLDWNEVKTSASNFTMVPGSPIEAKGGGAVLSAWKPCAVSVLLVVGSMFAL